MVAKPGAQNSLAEIEGVEEEPKGIEYAVAFIHEDENGRRRRVSLGWFGP